MRGLEGVIEIIENATLAEILEDLELANQYPEKYDKVIKNLLLAELEKRTNKKEVEE